jgi:hypothetical protein
MRSSAILATAAVALLVTACGSKTSSSDTPWAAAHPDPQGVHFAAAQGLCTITVRYPTEAPGEIDYHGSAYIQHERTTAKPQDTSPLATSGDWRLYQPAAHTLLLVTPSAAYTYQDGANCGSNSAAPT